MDGRLSDVRLTGVDLVEADDMLISMLVFYQIGEWWRAEFENLGVYYK